MDSTRFDRLAMVVGKRTSRRATIGLVTALGLTGLRQEEAGAAGCRQPGTSCRRRSQCCSGVCGHDKCRSAPGQGTCTIEHDACTFGAQQTCNGDAGCECWVTKKGTSFCGVKFTVEAFTCQFCKRNADCVKAGFPADSVCIDLDQGACGGCAGSFQRRACVKPCPTSAP